MGMARLTEPWHKIKIDRFTVEVVAPCTFWIGVCGHGSVNRTMAQNKNQLSIFGLLFI